MHWIVTGVGCQALKMRRPLRPRRFKSGPGHHSSMTMTRPLLAILLLLCLAPHAESAAKISIEIIAIRTKEEVAKDAARQETLLLVSCITECITLRVT